MRHRGRRGFTLVELLVVIGIIALLVGLLIPVVNNVRRSAYVANTKNLMQTLSAAITNYHLTFKSYPGVLPNKAYDYTGGELAPASYFATPGFEFFTQSEDLVVALAGGLVRVDGRLYFDAAYLGQGPTNFNPLNPGKSPAFMSANAGDLSPVPPAGTKPPPAVPAMTLADPNNSLMQTHVKDSMAPEYMDKFPSPDNRPIIYMRANPVARNAGGGTAPTIVSNGYRPEAHYNFKAMAVYLKPDEISPPSATPSADDQATKYFTSEQSAGTAKYAGTYILISAGKDGKYGTEDDLIMGGGGGQ